MAVCPWGVPHGYPPRGHGGALLAGGVMPVVGWSMPWQCLGIDEECRLAVQPLQHMTVYPRGLPRRVPWRYHRPSRQCHGSTTTGSSAMAILWKRQIMTIRWRCTIFDCHMARCFKPRGTAMDFHGTVMALPWTPMGLCELSWALMVAPWVFVSIPWVFMVVCHGWHAMKLPWHQDEKVP